MASFMAATLKDTRHTGARTVIRQVLVESTYETKCAQHKHERKLVWLKAPRKNTHTDRETGRKRRMIIDCSNPMVRDLAPAPGDIDEPRGSHRVCSGDAFQSQPPSFLLSVHSDRGSTASRAQEEGEQSREQGEDA